MRALVAAVLLAAAPAGAADLEHVTLTVTFGEDLERLDATASYRVRFAEGEDALRLVSGDTSHTITRVDPVTSATVTWSGAASTRGGFAFTGFDTAEWLPLPSTPRGPDLIADRFTWDITLIVPDGLKSVASGRADPATPHRYTVDEPTPAYLLGFAVGPFARRVETLRREDGSTVTLQYLLSSEEAFDARFGTTATALAFLEVWTGVRYPDPVYTQVLLPGGLAQEKSGFALLGERTVALADTAPEEAWYVSHELAHQWFGRILGPVDWSENWLNEGFAVLMTKLSATHDHGVERGRAEVTRARTRYARARDGGRDRPLRVPDWSTPGDSGGPIPYTKGLLVLHHLRQRLTPEVFDPAVRWIFSSLEPGERFTSEMLLSALATTGPVDPRDALQWIDAVGDPAPLLGTTAPATQ